MKSLAYLLALLLFLFTLPQATSGQSAQTTTPAAPQAAAQTADEVLAGAARALVEQLLKEDYAGAAKNFDENMRAALPADKLQEIWTGLKAQVGALKRQTALRVERSGPYTVVVMTCEFERVTLDMNVAFNSSGQIAGLNFVPSSGASSAAAYRAPAYVRPESFQEREVTVGAGEWALPGTLSMPAGKGPFPAVVLVHGSGPNDRDETVGPNKPFRDIAGGLASKGIAVLRYDKRTKVHGAKISGPAANAFTVKEETIDDALAAVSLLRKTEGIDPRRVFVLGHSLGGMLAPRIGRADPQIKGLIVMAGNSRPVEDLILEQLAHNASEDGTVTKEEQASLDRFKQQVARLKDPQTTAATPAADMPFGIAAHYWLDLRGYRAAEDARTLKQPLLILQGERDYQVTLADFEGWKILAPGKTAEFKSYPKLNHLFLEGEGKSFPGEYSRAGNVPKYVIDDLAAWLGRH